MIHLENGETVPVEKSELPIELPEDVNLNSDGNPLNFHLLETYNTKVYRKKQ